MIGGPEVLTQKPDQIGNACYQDPMNQQSISYKTVWEKRTSGVEKILAAKREKYERFLRRAIAL